MRTWGHGRFKGFKILPSLEKEVVFFAPWDLQMPKRPTHLQELRCNRCPAGNSSLELTCFSSEFPPSPSMFSSIAIPQRCKTSSHWIQNPRNLMLIASPQTKNALQWNPQVAEKKILPQKNSWKMYIVFSNLWFFIWAESSPNILLKSLVWLQISLEKHVCPQKAVWGTSNSLPPPKQKNRRWNLLPNKISSSEKWSVFVQTGKLQKRCVFGIASQWHRKGSQHTADVLVFF